MRSFITGGAGFIGSHLVDRLMAEGNAVTVYDNLFSGKKEWIAHHIGKPGFQFIQADMVDSATLVKSMRGYDIVWHLGANTDIPGGNRQTDQDLRYCVIATHAVLEAMRQNGVKQLLFSSSAAVYGERSRETTAEDAGPLLPVSLYGAGKLAGEGFISAYCHLFDIRACIFRFGNVLGARMGHGVIYDFIHKLRRDPKELEILGDGNQEKNYFLVEDCLDGMLCALHNSKKQCDVFNLGTPTTVKVSDIARIVSEEMGLKDVRLRFTGGERGWPGDVPKVLYDVSKINRLGWQAKHTSAEAVRIAARRLLGEGGMAA
jgi:UDP-glucose 4-epimerase